MDLSTGYMTTGFKQIDGKWYFFRPGGDFEDKGADILWNDGLEYDTPLLACCAAEALYPHWLAAQMDLALGETARAANELQLYTSYVQEFAVWVRRNYMPAGGGKLLT